MVLYTKKTAVPLAKRYYEKNSLHHVEIVEKYPPLFITILY